MKYHTTRREIVSAAIVTAFFVALSWCAVMHLHIINPAHLLSERTFADISQGSHGKVVFHNISRKFFFQIHSDNVDISYDGLLDIEVESITFQEGFLSLMGKLASGVGTPTITVTHPHGTVRIPEKFHPSATSEKQESSSNLPPVLKSLGWRVSAEQVDLRLVQGDLSVDVADGSLDFLIRKGGRFGSVRLALPETSVSEIYRRMCFNVLSGNTDDHDRNFSFIMDENGVWSLAPAYDITFTNDIFSPSPTPRAMSVCGKRHGISMDDLKSFARKEGIVDSGHILTQVADTVARFEEFAKRNDMQPHWRSRIGNDIRENLSYNKANATVATSFQIDGQCCVDKVYVKESEKGVVEFGCLIDSIRCRKFFQPESEIAKVFRNLGMEFMPAADMERLAIQLLVFPYIGHESTSDVSVHLHEKMTCDRKTDVVDDSGRSVLPHPVDAIASASDGFALVRNDGKFNFADVDTCSSGWCPRFLLETWADWAFSFHNGTAHVVYDGKHMIVARDGSLTMEDLTPPRPKLR